MEGVKMSEKFKAPPFSGTPEQKKKLLDYIAATKDEKGSLMPIMQKAQEIYGFLPIQVQTIISDATGHPLEEIYGIATFYSMFRLNPQGKHRISVCLGTACYVRGSAAVLEKIKEVLGIETGGCTSDGLFSLEDCRCVGACGLAPVMMIDDVVYGRMTPDKVEGILNSYRV